MLEWATRHKGFDWKILTVSCGNLQPVPLSLVGRYALDRGGEPRMSLPVDWPMANVNARRVLPKEIIVPPVRRWPDRPGNKASSAVRTDVLKHVVDTLRTKRALVGTNACFQRVRRK